ncbi:hypothetical protein POF50_007330 [Streptomyces sp. SL13]|uniref:Uncharacterized protein n=1 Tax=Streptantibioticus silvisoli TaxID=2705255 RepID=A0AA90H722_9ACTN|nr:hypothetical protein [Streptantibioticus silvisoli]MDI5969157.1 hypothetical protein [Streptantibioticus silvisoli]
MLTLVVGAVLERRILTGTPGSGKTDDATGAGAARVRAHEPSHRRFDYDLVEVPAGEVADRGVHVTATVERLGHDG